MLANSCRSLLLLLEVTLMRAMRLKQKGSFVGRKTKTTS